jgi:ribose-phosphate pyrophosphokinase
MTVLLAFPGMEPLGKVLAGLVGAEYGEIELHRFPDGESLVTLPGEVAGRNVAILATLRDPDTLGLPLRFAALTARELGATRVGLVAPYLAYMRQDRRFAPGQAVSAPLFARFLEEAFDWLVTADPHLHRIPALGEVFGIPAERVVTAPLLAEWIGAHVTDPVLLGPDGESKQWVAEVALLAGCPYQVLHKHRSGDRRVEVSAPAQDAFRARTPVILDDIASSGRTMIEAIERLKTAGTAPPVCILIHAVFAGSAYEDILAAGAARLVSTDSIPHSSNAISLASALAMQTRPHLAEDATK